MSRRPQALFLPPIDAAALPAAVFGPPDRQGEAVARIVAEHVAPYAGPVAVATRAAPSHALAVIGWFTDDEAAGVRAALDGFAGALSRLRYVSYAQAEADCQVLADRLRARLSPDVLEAAVFTGIPRGGLIVLGMLGYTLGLRPEQLRPAARPDAPLILVDDCFLSGHRVSTALAAHADRPSVVPAALYAHPDLCAAIERDHPVVPACLHARALTDHAPALLGAAYPHWAAKWRGRLNGSRYWTGLPDRLCFAWSEPHGYVWNDEAEQVEPAWRTVPADRCLRTRHTTRPAAPIQAAAPPAGTLRPAPDTLAADFEVHVVVARPDMDACLVLEGTAADFWRALLAHGDLEPARTALGATYDVPPARLERDLRAFARALSARGLLQRAAPTPPSIPDPVPTS
jgi:hypothetical protein